ncbi:MAG: hypothetical protein QM667_10845 [Asticcacaulis sp.]
MSKEKKIGIARAVMTQLHASEEAIDTALSETAQLIETYVTSRRAIRMAPSLGPDVHRHTLEAMLALRQAQEKMSDAHTALRRVQTEVGLPPAAVVPINDKPEKEDDGKSGVSDVLRTAV